MNRRVSAATWTICINKEDSMCRYFIYIHLFRCCVINLNTTPTRVQAINIFLQTFFIWFKYLISVKEKGIFPSITCHGDTRYSSTISLTSAADEKVWSTQRLGCFTPRQKAQISFVWMLEPGCRKEWNLSLAGFWNPRLSSRCESVVWRRYNWWFLYTLNTLVKKLK
jgi:hypothetical protein